MVKKDIVMTFKADGQLLKALKKVPNRSEFIRSAILSALENACPLCGGTGIFTPDQRKHWEMFNKNHVIEQCNDCHAVHIVCKEDKSPGKNIRHQ